MADLSMFGDAGHSEQFPAGHEFFVAGDAGDLMYVVLKGEVEIVINGKVVETVRAGGLFGEMAIIDHHERSATARVKTPVEVATMDQKRFIAMLSVNPFFAIEVMTVMAERLRLLNQALL
ncbi:MAG TPA: cyclic nucleotide-binding domain-containing protein [Candidatus Acidoferrales bacterium]|nr:cyclic nucleotide-binding domain-containing protein [Candidatus Acidoferrales bacterium]